MPGADDNSSSSSATGDVELLRAENLRLQAENAELRKVADRVEDANAYAAEMAAALGLARAEHEEKERRFVRDIIELKRAQETLAHLHHQNQLALDCAGEGICSFDTEGRIAFCDIPARNQAEEGLRESEKHFRSLVEHATIGIYRTTPQGRILTANPTLVRMLGYENFEELAARNLEEEGFEPDYARSSFRKQIEREGEVSGLEEAWTKQDGSVIFVRESARAIRRADGEVLYYDGIVEDITERKQAEKKLEERTAFLNLLIEKSPLAIVVVDSNERVQMCNPAFERLFQYPLEETVGTPLNELIAPPELLAEANDYSQRSGEGESVMGTTLRRRKDGTLVDVELHGVPLISEGKYLGTYGLYQDITERKKAESEMRKAKEAAEAACRVKSEFLANMSHEIRTPLNGVIGMTNLALDTDLGAEQREYLSTAIASAESLLGIINDILDFSKIEAKKLDFEHIPFSLKDVVNGLTKLLALRAAEKGLKLRSSFEPGLPADLLGDPGRLRQILMNLVGNAIKFTERGEVVVRVENMSEEPAGEVTLHFSVKDTGIGIPLEKQRMIFDAFTQADASYTRQFGGTGLGLAITSQLVKMMGGKVWVESAVGRGSTFHLTVCLGVVQAPAGSPKRPQLDTPQSPAKGRGSLRVLVVEDNRVNRLLAVRLIEKLGHCVKGAGSGQEALEAVREGCFDLVLMDVQMPGMDGFETTRAIRRQECQSGQHLPIIAVTAHTMQGDWERCLAAGMDGYVAKPINRKDLSIAIETVMGNHRPIAPHAVV
jgi:PAS domain S-box-containing protein